MIEIEKKFTYNFKSIEALTKGAQFLNKQIFTDQYFDDENYSLTSEDIWFRKRDSRYELKLPLSENTGTHIFNQYKELETETEISKYFEWNLSNQNFEDLIKNKGLFPFATLTTTRKKYKKDKFSIDIDTTDFGFNIIEIELIIENESQTQKAIKEITTFAKNYGLEIKYVRGKVLEYIFKNNKRHFDKLVEVGVINKYRP